VRSGEHPAARQTSTYTNAALHPAITATAAMAAAGIGALLYRRRRRLTPDARTG